MKKFADWTIQTKLIVVISLLVIIPQIVLAYLATNRFTVALKRAAEEDLEHIVSSLHALCESNIVYEKNAPSIPAGQLSKIRSVMRSIVIGETGYPYIIDQQGTLIVHPTKAGENIIDSQDSKGNHFIKNMIAKAVVLGDGRVGENRYPWINVELGETSPRMKLTKFRYIPQLHWIIAAGSYEEEIFGAVYQTQKTVVIMTIISLAIVLVFMVLLSRFLTSPILQLIRVSSKMAEGDFSDRVDVSRRDEIGQLTRAFNHMYVQIQEHTKNLEQVVSQRTQELLDSKEKYKEISALLTNILESSTEYAIIATDLHWSVLEFNTGARKIFGWTKEEIAGEDISKTYVEKGVVPYDYETYQKLCMGEAIERETGRRRNNGEEFLGRSVTTAMRDMRGEIIGYLEISRDVTERKRLEREFQETKDFLESILDSSVDGIVTTDIKGMITYINRGMEEILQSVKEAYIGKHVSLLYLDGIADARKIMSVLRRDQKVTNYEMTLTGAGGREIPINTSAGLLKNFRGEVIGTVGIFKDLTEKKKLEAELQKTEASLLQAAKLRELGELVSGVAHEINNPLMASQTILFRIKQSIQDSEHHSIRRLTEIIEKCNDRIATIVNHLREFSRETEMRLRPLDVEVPLNNALLITGQQLMNHNIQVVKDTSGSLPKIMGSEHHLEQVFLNIISNARDALDKQDDNKELIIRSFFRVREGKPGEVIVSFTDTGPGIPPEIKYKIFDPFFSTKEVGSGTGLGLSICYGIVEKHEGRIEVDSEFGKGATFSVILPAISNNFTA